MTAIYNPPAHPLIYVPKDKGYILLIENHEGGIMSTPFEAITLGLALMETGLHLKALQKTATDANGVRHSSGTPTTADQGVNMSAEETSNQEGGSGTTGTPPQQPAPETVTPPPTPSPAMPTVLTTGVLAPTPGTDAHAEHLAGMHAALKNLAKDFKAMGADFGTAAKDAWEAEV